MRSISYLSPLFLVVCAAFWSTVAASWGFEDGTLSVHGKKAGVGSGAKEKYATLEIV